MEVTVVATKKSNLNFEREISQESDTLVLCLVQQG